MCEVFMCRGARPDEHTKCRKKRESYVNKLERFNDFMSGLGIYSYEQKL